jgi:threonine dehydrogenase-like Zn-dependent dehydrogenase
MDVREVVFADIDLVEVRRGDPPEPPGAGEVLVAPDYVGLCGSELHVLHGRHSWTRPPVVPGHEVVATVVAPGPGVTRWSPGDRVLLNPLVPCGECLPCRQGRFNSCETARVIGFRLPGAARTLFTHPARLLHAVPDNVASDLACLGEPLACGIHAAGRSRDHDRSLVVGGGTIGLCVLLALKARKAGHVTVVEPSASKRALALYLGADEAHAPEALPSGTPRFTAAFDCVANRATVQTTIAAVVGGGTVVMVGVPGTGVELPLARMQRYEIDLVGSGMYVPADLDAALAYLASDEADVASLLSAVYPLAAASQAYAATGTSENVKVLIKISGQEDWNDRSH